MFANHRSRRRTRRPMKNCFEVWFSRSFVVLLAFPEDRSCEICDQTCSVVPVCVSCCHLLVHRSCRNPNRHSVLTGDTRSSAVFEGIMARAYEQAEKRYSPSSLAYSERSEKLVRRLVHIHRVMSRASHGQPRGLPSSDASTSPLGRLLDGPTSFCRRSLPLEGRNLRSGIISILSGPGRVSGT